jgi:outer membrane receptor protein involved in Fe transport
MHAIRVTAALPLAAAYFTLAEIIFPPPASAAGAVEDVVVTAQRRAETLMKAPQSASAFTPDPRTPGVAATHRY